MNQSLPDVYLARHGETAWSLSGRHTGRTDIPLTERGEDNARRLRGRLEGITFTEVSGGVLGRAAFAADLGKVPTGDRRLVTRSRMNAAVFG